jgi:hypothetical protein
MSSTRKDLDGFVIATMALAGITVVSAPGLRRQPARALRSLGRGEETLSGG